MAAARRQQNEWGGCALLAPSHKQTLMDLVVSQSVLSTVLDLNSQLSVDLAL